MADSAEKHTVLCVTKIATTALEAYRFVKLSTDDEACEYPAAQYAEAYGITQHAAKIGDPVEVMVEGMSLLKVDGAVAAIANGDPLTVHDAAGFGQRASGAAGRPIIAIARYASTVDGDCINVAISLGRALTTA